MRTSLIRGAGIALAALAMTGLVACGDDEEQTTQASAGGETEAAAEPGLVGVLLPDSKSSSRWEAVDRPFLEEAFKNAGVPVQIENAQGDTATQQQQAEQAITNGAKVLLLVSLDPGSGAAITANAKSRGVKVIDYDRLTLESDSDYYVSFNNERVGELQAEGLMDCLEAENVSTPRIAHVNGSPTDNNAGLLKTGAATVLDPMYEGGDAEKVAEEDVPDWDNQRALAIFEQMLQKTNNEIDGVVAANDGIANSVISAVKARKLDPIPVTGGDATAQAITNIVNGDQCMTVYKAIKKEAEAAASLAIPLAKGEEPEVSTTPVDNGAKEVPSILLEAQIVNRDNAKDFVGEPDFPKREEICAGNAADACAEAGL